MLLAASETANNAFEGMAMKTIHLQGIGKCEAKLVSDVVIGDRLVWNYGYTSIVEGIEPVGKCFVRLKLSSEGSREVAYRKMASKRLVAYSNG